MYTFFAHHNAVHNSGMSAAAWFALLAAGLVVGTFAVAWVIQRRNK